MAARALRPHASPYGSGQSGGAQPRAPVSPPPSARRPKMAAALSPPPASHQPTPPRALTHGSARRRAGSGGSAHCGRQRAWPRLPRDGAGRAELPLFSSAPLLAAAGRRSGDCRRCEAGTALRGGQGEAGRAVRSPRRAGPTPSRTVFSTAPRRHS